MKRIFEDIVHWRRDGREDIVVATVLRTWGSAPRKVGAKLAVDASGAISGSVSGGCVEGAVVEAARQTLKNGVPQLLHFGVADDTAWSVGLACGGSIDIFVNRLDLANFDLAREFIERELPVTIVTVVNGPDGVAGQQVTVKDGGIVSSNLSEKLSSRVLDAVMKVNQPGVVRLDDTIDLFVDIIRPSPQLIAVGGGDITIAVTKIANLVGFKTVVIDPRRVFGSTERFPHIAQLIQKWPRSALAEIELTTDTAVAVLTHDPKIDDPAIVKALDSEAFYIGALGSRKTHNKRLQRLAGLGYSEEQLQRIQAPIGLDIGAANPQEIAVAIMAEILAAYRGRLS